MLSRDEVAALFAGTNLLNVLNWGPDLQIIFEEVLRKIVSPTGFTVAEVLLMTFNGYMQSKNKNPYQRKFTSRGFSLIPDWGAGRRRTESQLGSSSSSSSSITRRLTQLS